MSSQKLTIKDETFITGGPKTVNKNAADKFLKTSGAFKCNCGLFEIGKNCGHLDMCDNCEHSVKTGTENLYSDVYCSKQLV